MTCCGFCGRNAEECPGGIWNLGFRQRFTRVEGICIYCARAAIRAFGEEPDPNPGVIDLGARRDGVV